MPILSGFTGLFEGLTLSELKVRSLGLLKQTAGNYNRYSETNIEDALYDGLVEAVRITKCLRGFGIIQMKDGYSQYKPPSRMLLPDKFFFYQSATNYWELSQKSRRWLDSHKRGWRTEDGDPYFVYPGDTYGNMRKWGFYPTPDTDGDDYTLDPDTGIYVSESSLETSGNITGTNDTADASICTDSDGRTLSDLGILVGMMAVNVTDGSSGQISAVSGSTFTVTLAGGTNNTWAVGDSFMVLAGEYGTVVSWENDEQYLFTSDIGGMIDAHSLVNNVYCEYIRMPLKLSYDTQYPELPPNLHKYLPEYVPWKLKRNKPKTSTGYQEAVTAYQTFFTNISGGYFNMDQAMEDDAVLDCHLS